MFKMALEFTESNRHLREFEIIAGVFMKIAGLQHESLQCDINLPMFHRKLIRPPLQQTIYPGAADSRYLLQDVIFLEGCPSSCTTRQKHALICSFCNTRRSLLRVGDNDRPVLYYLHLLA